MSTLDPSCRQVRDSLDLAPGDAAGREATGPGDARLDDPFAPDLRAPLDRVFEDPRERLVRERPEPEAELEAEEEREFQDLLDLEVQRLAAEYPERRAEHPALAPFPTLGALVDKLTKEPKGASRARMNKLWAERALITSALLELYQEGRRFDPFWEALVLVALTPMRRSVRNKFTGADADEREGLFLAGASRVIRRVDPRKKPDKILGIIWLKTKQVVSRKLRKEHAWSDVGIDVEADETADESVPAYEDFVLIDIVSEANGGEMARARVPVGVLDREVRQIKAYVGREFGVLPAVDQRALVDAIRALKKKGEEMARRDAERGSAPEEVKS